MIDTGMGFERLCMALQGKTSNYDTDVFQPIIKVIADMAGTAYGKDKQQDVAMRVIADHIRTIAFAITDGQLPSVESCVVPSVTAIRSWIAKSPSCISCCPY